MEEGVVCLEIGAYFELMKNSLFWFELMKNNLCK
jgi:hypothetical protein